MRRGEEDMIPEVSVYLPNVPGQFSRVLKALASVDLNISGFSVDMSGAISELRLLFKDAIEEVRAKKALGDFHYETVERQLLLLAIPDAPGELLKVVEVMGENGINVEYGYVTTGKTETGDVLFVLKVDDGKAQLARDCLEAQGIKDHHSIPNRPFHR
jgi:hypothetical protein